MKQVTARLVPITLARAETNAFTWSIQEFSFWKWGFSDGVSISTVDIVFPEGPQSFMMAVGIVVHRLYCG